MGLPSSLNQSRHTIVPLSWVFVIMVVLGIGGFFAGLLTGNAQHAWQAYLINFLLWTGVAQGAVVFSAVTQVTKARWSWRLAGMAESFSAFFPFSLLLFVVLFIGKAYVFPWLHHDLQGKGVWLNLPFLFARDFIGLAVLYGLGMAYLYYTLRLRLDPDREQRHGGWLRRLVLGKPSDAAVRERVTILGILYILCFTLVGSLLGYDLVMSMDPHWVSTLFGAYSFVKAFYVGLGALVILACLIHMKHGPMSGLTRENFHDLGKLFFAFCLLWGDFYYVQLLVIWYGNIPEETHYVIQRSMQAPWNVLGWGVLFVCFVIPFFILLNKRIKTSPVPMIMICAFVIAGMWFEHLLLLGPAMNQDGSLSLGPIDVLVSLGFVGILAWAVRFYFAVFPEVARMEPGGAQ